MKNPKTQSELEKIVNRKHTLLESFNFAIEGLIVAIKIERNMKIHVIATIILAIVALFLRLNTLSLAILCFSTSLVWVAELLNSAIEKAVDLVVGTKYYKLAKQAKDIAAGAVFVASINAVIMAYLIFLEHTKSSTQRFMEIIRASYSHIGVLSLLIVAITVVSLKAIFSTGTPLQGGMPSGHSALASSAATIILLSTHNVGIVALTLFITALVAQSRVKAGIHSLLEVIVGLIIGFFITFILMFIFRV